ncbi:MAG: hypothetical protein B7Z55_11920, partial [Planctomycetales bacterium 12-60-4]
EDGLLPYIVMEHVVGKSLRQAMHQSGTFDVESIVRIGMQTAQGLAAAHAQGLIHRDIKPANILLQGDNDRVKIMDFGLARAVDDVSLTHTGLVVGTPRYMSPEQAQNLPVDHRSDLFSLGSVLYAMCTGRPAFRAATSLTVLRSICEDTPQPIREINPEIPQWLAQIVNRLLAKDPERRFQSAAELSQLLGQYLTDLQNPATIVQPLPPLKIDEPKSSHNTRKRSHILNWRITGSFLLLAGMSLALLEGTGVTHVTRLVGSSPRVTANLMSGLPGKGSFESLPEIPALPPADRPVKVFILAGDSNMGGRAKVSLLEDQLREPESQIEFAHLKNGEDWVVRNDVWIHYGNRAGNLTVGYGQGPSDRFGPELEFGFVVGDHFEEQVLIIKTEWGGASLYCDFRPPSSGRPSDDELQNVLTSLKRAGGKLSLEELSATCGRHYHLMIRDVHLALDNLTAEFPAYQGQGYEIAGFVWFQGWNDLIIPPYRDAYAENLTNLIHDIRRDLQSPALPIV